MTETNVSAPGKAIVVGEYAVLTGAPAISMAVNRRARVRIAHTEDSTHCVCAPGYLEDSYRFGVTAAGNIDWIDDLPAADSFALLECTWKQLRIGKERGLLITLDTADFFDASSGSKLGLGSSAALTTALAAALAGIDSAKRSVQSVAAEAHNNFQHGAGSGIDIATAVHGGVIEYQVGLPATKVAWPDDLVYRLFWSGKPVATTAKLSLLGDRSALPSSDRLAALSRAAVAAWQNGDVICLLSELRRYVSALEKYSIDHGLGIFEAGHQELADEARSYPDIIYKPCGAGGGDIGIVLGESNRNIDLFTKQAVASGFVALDIFLDVDGVLSDDKTPC